MPDDNAVPGGLFGLFGLSGKVAIVTGAAGGIGSQIARLFVEAGASVMLADRDETGMAAAAAAIRDDSPGATLLTHVYDQSDPASIEALVERTVREWGSLDVLINNAAAFGFAAIADLEPEEWDRIEAVNLRGVLFCCKSALARMTPAGSGRIVNISSIAARRFVLHDNLAYAATKAGIITLTQNLARELGPSGIRINCVVPGAIEIDTPPAEAAAATLRGPIMEPGFIPAGCAGQPRDIAAACLYLASESGKYVTGQALAVDGGISVS